MKRPILLYLALVSCLGRPAIFAQEVDQLPHHVIHPVQPPAGIDADTALAQAAAGATIPLWSSSITVGTKSYKYTMVGQNPTTKLTNQTSTVPAVLIPVVVTLSTGEVFDPTKADPLCSPQGTALSLTQASPIFGNFDYIVSGIDVGATQYVDFFQRANFWQFTGPTGVNPNYHVLLGLHTASALKVSVPAGHSQVIAAECGTYANIDTTWWDNYVQKAVLPALAKKGVGPTTLPIFLFYNVVQYQFNFKNCCILGYHNGLKNSSGTFLTYSVADYDTSQHFTGSGDIAALSHEIGEWMDDPTGANPTPPWGHIGQVTTFQSNLEVGDPLSDSVITVTMPNNVVYHPQELAFLSWFYHQSPSIGVNGWYSSNGTFTTPAANCR